MRGHAAAWILSFFFTALLFSPTGANGASYNESVNGDLSNAGATPTNIALSAGSNTLVASIAAGGDLDYFHISLPAGGQLTKLNVINYNSSSFQSFLGMQAGSTFTAPPSTGDPSTQLGYIHINDFHEGTDILPAMGTAFGAQGFVPPLTGSDYTFWAQEAGGVAADYSLEFVVAVPEPGTVALLALGGLGLLSRRRKV
jgi:hypothetical protein